MAGIYGPITEHPEYPIEDDRRFMVTIKAHEYEPEVIYRTSQGDVFGCKHCGFEKDEPFHPTTVETTK